MADTVPNSSDRDASLDPLASLHRMSNTAGLSSQEYVAVNLTAVAAILAGLATALIILSPLWLAVPVLAIALGVVALRQISSSNGTQTGRLLAWGGILLALGIGGFQLGGQLTERLKERPMKAEVLAVCDQLAQSLTKEDYQKTWSLFSDRFRTEKKIDYNAFSQQWARVQGSRDAGKIKSLKSNGLVDLQPGPMAATMLLIEMEKSAYVGRYTVVMSQRNGVWQIDDLAAIFPTPQPQQPPGGPSGDGMPGPR